MKKFYTEILAFVLKQAYACIFWGFLLAMIILTKYAYPLEGVIYRYDFLFIVAILFQIGLITTKLETWKEAQVIIIFHIIAMMMEIFKTHPSIGSWSYPEGAVLSLGGVPLFAGFMYSAVGSYIARIWRIFDFQYKNYPKKSLTILLAILIYINFFSHHFIWDFRWLLIGGVWATFGRTTIFFTPNQKTYQMNLAVGFWLVAFFIWIAENIATYMRIWVYPSQSLIWHMVGFEKITAWFLLMIISFVLVSVIHAPKERKDR